MSLMWPYFSVHLQIVSFSSLLYNAEIIIWTKESGNLYISLGVRIQCRCQNFIALNLKKMGIQRRQLFGLGIEIVKEWQG